MQVRVRDRGAEAPWGSGLTSPVVRTVTISDHCPCGEKRGTPRNLNQHDDGTSYSVDVWDNPCGHVDMYAAVVQEASRLCRSCRHDELSHMFSPAQGAYSCGDCRTFCDLDLGD